VTVNEDRTRPARSPGGSDDRTDRFLVVSVALTGFGRVELLGTGLTDTYLRAIDAVLPDGVLDELLEAVGEIPVGADHETDVESILADPKLGPVARNIILMWFCGTWTRLPDTWRTAYGVSPLDADRVVSAQAYQGGLQWVAAGAHPAGARQQGFGAWSLPPEPAAQSETRAAAQSETRAGRR